MGNKRSRRISPGEYIKEVAREPWEEEETQGRWENLVVDAMGWIWDPDADRGIATEAMINFMRDRGIAATSAKKIVETCTEWLFEDYVRDSNEKTTFSIKREAMEKREARKQKERERRQEQQKKEKERKRVEETMRKSEQQIQTALELLLEPKRKTQNKKKRKEVNQERFRQKQSEKEKARGQRISSEKQKEKARMEAREKMQETRTTKEKERTDRERQRAAEGKQEGRHRTIREADRRKDTG